MIFNILGCLLFILLGVWTFYAGLTYITAFPVFVIFGFALLLLGMGIYWAWKILTLWGSQAALYSNGFAHFDGKDTISFKWTEITSVTMQVTKMRVYHVIPVGTIRVYTIESPSAKLKLTGTLNKVDDLMFQIRKNAFPHIVKRRVQDLDAGKTLEFGPVLVSRSEGIKIRNKKYGWTDIAKLNVINGAVEVVPKKKGFFQGASAPVGSIPNLDVFMALSEVMIAQNSQPA